MARSRNIKPGFFINEDLVELPFSTRILFIGLWTIADRAGRLDDRPKKIKMAVFPADDVDIDEGLNQLASRDLLTRYAVDGERYIQITNFEKHQYPHPNEKESHIPAYDNSQSTHMPIHLNPSSLNPESLETESREVAATNGDQPTKKTPKKQQQSDEEFLKDIQTDFPHLDVAQVNRKMIAWCKVNNKQPTRRRLVNWLNREDVPIKTTRPPDPGKPTEKHEPLDLKCRTCSDLGEVWNNGGMQPCPNCKVKEVAA